MSITLTSEQLSILQAHSDAGDRIAYYSALEAFDVAYGGLALGVVLNNSIAGAAANAFLVSQALGGAENTDLLARIGTALMEADYAARRAVNGADLEGTDISDYHERVFSELAGANGEAWTPFNYLNTFERPDAFNAAWDEVLNSGSLGTYALISTRRMTVLWEYQDTHPGTEGYTPDELETFDRDALLAAGFDAQFLDWFNQYTDYLHDLQRAGIYGLDGASPYFSSNDYGNYDITNSSGQIIGGDAGSDGLSGGSGDDVVMGFSGDDTIAGSAGNDRIYGNGGSDLVDYGGETGPLRIELGAMQDAETARLFSPMASDWSIQRVVGENDADILVDIERISATSGDDTLSFSGDFEDILQGDAVAYGGIDLGSEGDAGDTLDLSLLSGSASVLLEDGRAEIYDGRTPSNFATVFGAENVIGTEFSDEIQGDQEANLINGGAGADILRGGAGGNDTLVGGTGADRLYYADGMVTLEGGEGNDYYDFSEVTGTDRGATIILSGDFGHDMMSDRGNSMDRLVFSDVNFADVSFSYDYTVSGPYNYGYDSYFLSGALTITIDADNSFYIPYVGGEYVYSQGDWWTPEGYFSAYLQSPFTIEFADRSFNYWAQMFDVPVWDIPDETTPETAATALADHEAERAEEGSEGGDSGDDGGSGGDGSGGDEDALLIGSSGSDTLTGATGNDTFSAGAGDDVIAYSGGDDVIHGSSTTSINSGHDTLDLSAYTASDVSFTASGHDALIETPDGTITLEYQLRYEEGHARGNIEAIIFSDTTLDEAAIHARALADQASDGDDLVQGTIQDDTFYDTAGNDTLTGGDGDDLFVYQSGNDVIGGSNATAVNTGADTLDLSAYSASEVRFTVSGHDALVVTPDGTIELDYQMRYEVGNARSNIETIIFADITLDEAAIRARALGDQATDASEAITGTIQADVLHSGAGNDTFTGGQGADVFVFAAGDGNDRISDFTLGTDLLQVEATGFETLTITQIGSDVRIDYSESDSVVLANLEAGLVNADMFAFA